MNVVVDASVAVKSFLPEPRAGEAVRLLASSHELIAPELIRLEVANALVKALRRNALSLPDVQEALLHFSGFPIRLEPLASYAEEVPMVAVQLGGSVYDALYVLVAQRAGALVATGDGQLARTSRLAGVDAWLLDEPPPAALSLE